MMGRKTRFVRALLPSGAKFLLWVTNSLPRRDGGFTPASGRFIGKEGRLKRVTAAPVTRRAFDCGRFLQE
jgi:hypothetical protein